MYSAGNYLISRLRKPLIDETVDSLVNELASNSSTADLRIWAIAEREPLSLRMAIARALVILYANGKGERSSLSVLAEMAKSSHAGVRTAVADALSAVQTGEAIALLRSLQRDNHPSVKRAASEALEEEASPF